MAGRAEGAIKILAEEKRNLRTLTYALIGMVIARGVCDLEEIFALQKFLDEQGELKNSGNINTGREESEKK